MKRISIEPLEQKAGKRSKSHLDSFPSSVAQKVRQEFKDGKFVSLNSPEEIENYLELIGNVCHFDENK